MRGVIVLATMLLVGAASAQSGAPDISGRRLLTAWKGDDPNMRMVAEMIASTFASGFAWGGEAAGKQVYCPPADLKAQQVMSALETYLADNPDMAERPYGDAMAATLTRTGRGAIVFVGVLSILLSLVNWGLSLVSSAFMVKEIARRTDIRLDYRAAGETGYLVLGCGFTFGVTSAAAQLQANAASIPPSLITITSVIGFSETIRTWQDGLTTLVVLLLSVELPGAFREVIMSL